MIVVYDDYGGAHSTPVAAAIHLGVLAPDRVPSAKELHELPLFDRTTKKQHGYLVFMGVDNDGHQVYVLGRGPGAKTVERGVVSGFMLAGGETSGLRFFNTLPHVNWWMRIGGFLSRAQGWITLGRKLVTHGTRKAYPQFAALVAEARRWANEASAHGQLVGSDGENLGHLAGLSTKEGILPGINEVRWKDLSQQE